MQEIKPAKGNDQRTDLLSFKLNSLYVFIKFNMILQLPVCLFKQSPLTLHIYQVIHHFNTGKQICGGKKSRSLRTKKH